MLQYAEKDAQLPCRQYRQLQARGGYLIYGQNLLFMVLLYHMTHTH